MLPYTPIRECVKRNVPMPLSPCHLSSETSPCHLKSDSPWQALQCDLNRAVEGALEVVGSQLNAHGVRVDLLREDSLPPALGDSVRLEEVVINLAVNAMQALDRTGKEDKRIVLATRAENKKVVLEVRDNATGVTDTYRDRIFDPFFTTKGAEGGMGLGLPIVEAIVAAFKGNIVVLNNEMGGATFKVELPADGINN